MRKSNDPPFHWHINSLDITKSFFTLLKEVKKQIQSQAWFLHGHKSDSQE